MRFIHVTPLIEVKNLINWIASIDLTVRADTDTADSSYASDDDDEWCIFCNFVDVMRL